MLCRQYSVARRNAFWAVIACPAFAATLAFSPVDAASADHLMNQSSRFPGATLRAVASASPMSAEPEFAPVTVRCNCASKSESSRHNFMAGATLATWWGKLRDQSENGRFPDWVAKGMSRVCPQPSVLWAYGSTGRFATAGTRPGSLALTPRSAHRPPFDFNALARHPRASESFASRRQEEADKALVSQPDQSGDVSQMKMSARKAVHPYGGNPRICCS